MTVDTKLNLDDTYFYVISDKGTANIPAVELDSTTGEYSVLVFTSKDAAKRYCYLRKPESGGRITELQRKTVVANDGEVEIVQSELIKIARRILLGGHEEITSFVIDHPGTRSSAGFMSIEDVAYQGRKQVDPGVTLDGLKAAIERELQT